MRLFTAVLLVLIGAGTVQAATDLRQEASITAGLITVGIAIEISDRCPTIGRRNFRGISYLKQLRSMARDLGYSNAEVDEFINDRDEKARLEEVARAQLAAMGANAGDEQSYCLVGKREIESDSMIGYLLK